MTSKTSCYENPCSSMESSGGILMLELIELKEELAQEREELDYLRQQHLDEKIKHDSLAQKVTRQSARRSLYWELMELQYTFDDLNQTIGMYGLEIEILNVENKKLEQRIIHENNHGKGMRPTLSKTRSLRMLPNKRSSRSLRHQKRRETAPLVSRHLLNFPQSNSMIPRTA
mmetsp:Transcript_10927/g.16107  ORF Transcript_10927/g.16107 Transcript_10927/m.16107 type:complete len:172 (-) Transcript_10927:40-555(-)